jgi:hypothetical protein
VPGLEIYSTDLAELLPLAEHNVKLNDLESNVHVKELYWCVNKIRRVICRSDMCKSQGKASA